MDLDKILISLEKQGWKLEKDFLDNNENFLQDLVDETEKQLTIHSVVDTLVCDCDLDYSTISKEIEDNKCTTCSKPIVAN